MYKKLFTTSIINAATAVVNIFSSFIIVKVLSLQIFGELAIFSSYLALGGLIFALIPSNFSIFKLQDDKKYQTILLSFFILASVFFSFFVVIMNISGLIKMNFLIVYLFGISTFFLGYFDIKFQAFGQLNKYFIMLFIVSILKIFTLIVFFYLGRLNSLIDLIWTMNIVQLLVITFFLFQDRKELISIFKNVKSFKETLLFIKNNFSIFKSYYLNTFLKRFRENIIVLIYSKFTSNDIIGLFSIFVKITSFVFGLSRTIEAFFMNRLNIEKFKDRFYQKIIYFAISLQIIFLIVGIIYLKFFVNKYYFFEILIQSFLVYPHVFFLLARSEMYSKYSNNEANISEIIYVVIVLISGVISYSFHLISIYPILTAFILSTFGLQFYMIFSHYKKIKNRD
jgi:hypothetical protein